MTPLQRLSRARQACNEAKKVLLYAHEHLEGAGEPLLAQQQLVRAEAARVEGLARELRTVESFMQQGQSGVDGAGHVATAH